MQNRLYKITFGVSVLLLLFCSTGYAGNIDPDFDDSRYAYGENVGWINLEPSLGAGVTVTDTGLEGYAWGENIGWINLSPANYGGVINDGAGNLSGYAWGENVGWINFAPTTSGVTIDPATGVFSGYAWGENIGWINFASVTGGVKTAWRQDAGGSGGGGSGGTCFIATAGHESPMQPYVKMLRKFCDRFLIESSFGKFFVNLYCKY